MMKETIKGIAATGVMLIALAANAGSTGAQQQVAKGSNGTPQTVPQRLEKLTFADDYATIQQAIDAAGANGNIVIPSSYLRTDTYVNPKNIPVIDLRNHQLGVWSVVAPGRGVSAYPMGNDLVMRTAGPADAYIEHLNVTTTTTATLVEGSNIVPIATVRLGNNLRGTQQVGNAYMFSTAAGLIIGRDTPSEEQVNSFTIVDGTHLKFATRKAHHGLTDIEQVGSTILASRDLHIWSSVVKASQSKEFNPPLVVKDLHATPMLKIPSDAQGPFPFSLFQTAVPIAGFNGASQDLLFQNSTATSTFKWRNHLGTNIATLTNRGDLELASGALSVDGNALTNGSKGAIQIGKNTAATTSTTDALITWSDKGDPLNPSATAGSLVLAARNISGSEVVLASQNAVRLRAGGRGVGFNGAAPSRPTITGSRGGNEALQNLLIALQAMGLIIDKTTP